MTDMGELQELIWGWANSTLDGPQVGVVGATDGWRWERNTRVPLFTELLSDEFATGHPERALAVFDPTFQFGPLLRLERGMGRDAYGRSGRKVVRFLVGPEGFDVAQALLVALQEIPVTEWQDGWTPDPQLPPLPLPDLPGTAPSLDGLTDALDSLQQPVTRTTSLVVHNLAPLVAAFAKLPEWDRARIGFRLESSGPADEPGLVTFHPVPTELPTTLTSDTRAAVEPDAVEPPPATASGMVESARAIPVAEPVPSVAESALPPVDPATPAEPGVTDYVSAPSPADWDSAEDTGRYDRAAYLSSPMSGLAPDDEQPTIVDPGVYRRRRVIVAIAAVVLVAVVVALVFWLGGFVGGGGETGQPASTGSPTPTASAPVIPGPAPATKGASPR